MPFVVKNTSLPGLLDLLFPHSCRGCGAIGEVFCERCKNNITKHHQNICPQCKKPKKSATCKNCQDLPPIYVVSDRNGLLGNLIHDYKYHSIRALARPLAEMLNSVLPATFPKNTVIVPLPTATHHIRSRGLDHTYKIARNLSRLRHFPLQKLLIRNKNTVQVGADREKRLSQVASAYALSPKYQVKKDVTYLLIDDVWTTGASVLTAKKLLESVGAKNIKIALLAYSS